MRRADLRKWSERQHLFGVGVPLLLPAGAIGPSRLSARIRIQYQSMRRMPRIEVEHIAQRTSQRVERTIAYPTQIPVVFDEAQKPKSVATNSDC